MTFTAIPPVNRLSNSSSLYLQQHKDQPVAWWPWCEEAFDAAKQEDKPILISIGYASCHWCHVMAKQCFSDPYIAKLMNEHFICIKVDREERPDLDQIYIEAVQMIQQQAGWPLNVFCMPDGRPFFGGTYFPPKDIGKGIVPWPQLLMRIQDHYAKDRPSLEENADNIIQNLMHANNPASSKEDTQDNKILIQAAHDLINQFDSTWGGFGEEPKFPPSMGLTFLLELLNSQTLAQSEPTLTKNIETAINVTLNAMAHGGIYDQLEGGFFRYSVDTYWMTPHFEKMLYDNALLIDIYSKAYTRYREPLYKAIATECIHWVNTNMQTQTSLLAASLDADTDGNEGDYYTWTPQEVEEVLGGEAPSFCLSYHITKEGNFKQGRSVLALAEPEWETRKLLTQKKESLLARRKQRTTPQQDPKQITQWNCLLAKGLTQAGFTFSDKKLIDQAQAILDTLWARYKKNDNQLFSCMYNDKGIQGETLNDYASYAEACLAFASKVDLFIPGSSQKYIDKAISITQEMIQIFSDAHTGGFYTTKKDAPLIAIRKKEWWDNALPSGNASAMHALGQLYNITGEDIYLKHYNAIQDSYSALIKRSPLATVHALSSWTNQAIGIPIIYFSSIEARDTLLSQLNQTAHRTFFCFYKEALTLNYQICIKTQCVYNGDEISELLSFIS